MKLDWATMEITNFNVQLILCFILQAGGTAGLLMDLAANEKAVHADFFNGQY